MALIRPEQVFRTRNEKEDDKKVYFVSLGCPKNLVDGEVMLGTLAQDGYRVANSAAESDVIVVNTCSFVDEAKEESIEAIFEMAAVKEQGGQKLIVSGCLSQRYSEALEKEMPEVDLFIGTGEYQRIGELLEEEEMPRVAVGRPYYVADHMAPRVLSTPGYTAYVRIAEGCSQRCTFCIIPRLRGKARSRQIESVVKEVHELVDSGVVEFNLIAQDLTHYGDDLKDQQTTLAALLRELVKIEGAHWFRLMYCYPHNFTDELVELIRTEEKVCSYVDIPLQHVDDRMLAKMQRRTTEEITRDLMHKLRSIPDMVLRTTFIVGHPGETDESFEKLYNFVKEVKFDRMGVFRYSQEEETRSARMDEQVPEDVKDERYHRLMTLQQEVSRERMEALMGKEFDVVVEGLSDETDLLLQARHYGQAPEIDGYTYLNEGVEGVQIGDICRVRVVDTGDYDVVAQVLERVRPAQWARS